MTWAGLILIAWAMLALTASQDSLGIWMTPAVVGSAMIVWPRHNVTTVGRLLSGKFMNLTGLISFSLYLWHWPVIVYFRYYSFGTMPNLFEAGFLFVLSYGLAYASWRYVEPARYVSWTKAATILAGITATAALASLAAAVNLSQGAPWRLPPEAHTLLSARTYNSVSGTADCNISAAQKSAPACLRQGNGKEKILVFGDSHANALLPGLRTAFPDAHITRITGVGCRLQNRGVVRKQCEDLFNAAFSEYIPQGSFDKILWATRWVANAMPGVRQVADDLSAHGKLYVVGQAVEYLAPLPDLLMARYFPRRSDDPDQFSRFTLVKRADRNLEAALEGSGATFLSIADLTCVDAVCEKFAPDGTPFNYDRDHLTVGGSEEVVKRLAEKGLLR